MAVEIDKADCARAAAANPLRSLAARALAARRDDDIELRREAMQPPVNLLLLVLLDADCAATERIESRRRERELRASFRFFPVVEISERPTSKTRIRANGE